MDVEAIVARRLSETIGLPAFLEMPAKENDPGELITVEQTSGGGGFLEPFALDVDCWSTVKQRKRTKAISDLVKQAVPDLEDELNIFNPKVENVYRMNDPDTGRSRYVVSITLWVCE